MSVSRRSAIKTMTAGVLGAAAGIGGHGFLFERHDLALVRATLPVSGLAPAHDGLRIGLLTDFHHSAFVSQSDIARAVSLIAGQQPDLIVLGGDYVSHGERNYMRPCAEALSALTAPHGIYAILGNHDDDVEMPAALRAQRFVVLQDARTTLTIRGEPLVLAGVQYWTTSRREIGRVIGRRNRETVVLLAHDPSRLAEAAELSVPAMLSGHTHGGQIVLPGLGAVAARHFPIVAGLGSMGPTSAFVSRGIGTVYVPVRIACPPDVAIVTLKASKGDL